MDFSNVQNLIGFELMSQVFKNASGNDSNTFELVMASVLKSMNESGTDFNKLGFGNTDLSKLGYGEGTPLKAAFDDVQSNIKTGNTSIDEAVDKASKKYGVDKKLILAVIKQESSFNPGAVSSAGAEGLMQLMPSTAESLGVSNPLDIDQNVDGGTKYLKDLLDMYGNCKELALSAYNAGPGTVRSRGVYNKDEVYKMPSETRSYVQNVMKYYNE